MLTERKLVDLIEVLENGALQVREATVIARDGVEVTRTFHRRVLSPGDDVSGENVRVKAIAAAVWTDEVVLAFMEAKEASTPAPT